MNSKKDLLRALPKVDDILNEQIIVDLLASSPRLIVIEAIRTEIEGLRQAILADEITDYAQLTLAEITNKVATVVQKKSAMQIKPVVNATGVVLHTNLGRASLSERAKTEIAKIASGYCNLEFDLETGGRGKRYDHVEALICQITGAEAALVVNNNAAAVMLILATIAQQKEVIVSRGELVEIGGSFRVPDVMTQSGAFLKEVGTTNKTHARDYRDNINENTAALLKVHTSNYRIVGFSKEVELKELVAIGRENQLPLIYDLGCGLLYDLAAHGIGDEMTVQQAVATGADIICFSGDKLLGGPQAGIIVGKKEYIQKMKQHQLLRALRIDKLTLVALEATFRSYLDLENAAEDIPVLKRILSSKEELTAKAQQLVDLLQPIKAIDVLLEEGVSQVGGGSMPTVELATMLVTIKAKTIKVDDLSMQLRSCLRPIIVRIKNDTICFGTRTLEESDFPYIAQELERIVNKQQ